MKKPAAKNTALADDGKMRERILKSAFELFCENGYGGTSTLEIATRAKVSKRDLYALFDSKKAMLLACMQSRGPRGPVRTGMPSPRSRKELASILVRFATDFLTEVTHPSVVAMFRLAISEAERSPEVARALEDRRAAVRHSIAEYLARVQSAGLLAGGNTVQMARQYFTLLWVELQLDLLLGVSVRPNSAEIKRRAIAATDAFLRVNGT